MLYQPSIRTDESDLEILMLRRTLQQAVQLITDYSDILHRVDQRRARQVCAAAADVLTWTNGEVRP